MKPRRTTPATTPQRRNVISTTPNSNRHNNRTSTQRSIWDFIQPILSTQPATPINIPDSPSTASVQDLQTQDSQQQTPTTTPIQPNTATPADHAPDPPPIDMAEQPPLLQQPLQSEKNNRPWGDTILFQRPEKNFRVISKNKGTLNPNMLDMVAITNELLSKGASIFAAQEPNIHWTPLTTQQILSQARRNTPQIAIATSTSTEEAPDWYKPGGMFILAMNQWTSRIVSRGSDCPLGRWSYLKLMGKMANVLS